MSLGLNDLKKKPTKNSNENWARTTTTARPWTSSGLAKGPKAGRPRKENAEAFMSDEWASDYTSSIHAFDMEAQSPLTQLRDLHVSLKEQAVEIERKIKRAAMGPFMIMRSVLQMVQK